MTTCPLTENRTSDMPTAAGGPSRGSWSGRALPTRRSSLPLLREHAYPPLELSEGERPPRQVPSRHSSRAVRHRHHRRRRNHCPGVPSATRKTPWLMPSTYGTSAASHPGRRRPAVRPRRSGAPTTRLRKRPRRPPGTRKRMVAPRSPFSQVVGAHRDDGLDGPMVGGRPLAVDRNDQPRPMA